MNAKALFYLIGGAVLIYAIYWAVVVFPKQEKERLKAAALNALTTDNALSETVAPDLDNPATPSYQAANPNALVVTAADRLASWFGEHFPSAVPAPGQGPFGL